MNAQADAQWDVADSQGWLKRISQLDAAEQAPYAGYQHRPSNHQNHLTRRSIMATIIWIKPKPQGTAKSRYKARRATKVAERRDDEALGRKVAVIASGCSISVFRAVTAPGVRSKEESSGGICIPDVAIYAAGHRKPTKSIYPAR